jgi:hypothetical protein
MQRAALLPSVGVGLAMPQSFLARADDVIE